MTSPQPAPARCPQPAPGPAPGVSPPQQDRPFLTPKDLVWLTYLYPGEWLARWLPPKWTYALGDALAWFAPFALRTARRRLMERLARALPAHTPAARRDQIARDYLRRAVRRFQDDLVMAWHPPERIRGTVEVVNIEHLAAALDQGRGALLIGGHFFASRAAKRHLARIGYPALSVRHHAPQDRRAGRFGRRFLQPRYIRFLSRVLGEEVAVKDPDCSLKMLARLRANGLIDLHMDAAFSRDRVAYDFLGSRSNFAAGYLHLAWIAGAPLVPLLCLGDSRRLRIEFGAAVNPSDWPDRSSFVAEGLDRMVKTLEEHVLKAPEQWDLWIRW